MAKKLYEEETIRGIANKIREKAYTEDQYSTDDMADGIDAVYETGYTDGSNSVPTQYGGVTAQVTPQMGDSIGPSVSMSYTFDEAVKIDPRFGSTVQLAAPLSDFGNAQTDDVTEGVTFTAEGGFLAVGTGKRLSEEDEAEINTQAELIAQIKETAETLPDGSGGGSEYILYGEYVLSPNITYANANGVWIVTDGKDVFANFYDMGLGKYITQGVSSVNYEYGTIELLADDSDHYMNYDGAYWYCGSTNEGYREIFDGIPGAGDRYRVLLFNKPVTVTKEEYDLFMAMVERSDKTVYEIGQESVQANFDYIALWDEMLGDVYTEVGGGDLYDENEEWIGSFAPTSVLARESDSLRCIIIPQGIQASYEVGNTYDLIVIPRTIENIVENVFDNAPYCTVVCLATTPPTLGWQGYWSSDGGSSPPTAIYVPDESVDLYKNDTTWAEYADAVRPLSEFNYSAME